MKKLYLILTCNIFMDYEIKFSQIFLSPKKDEDRMTPKLRTKSPSKKSALFQLSPVKFDSFELDSMLSFSSPVLTSPLNKSPIIRKISQKYLLSFPFESRMSDFYPHPIDWSPDDIIAICNANQIHLFSVKSSISPTFTISCQRNDSMSLKFSQDGSKINVGFANGKIRIYDMSTLKMIDELTFFDTPNICESVTCIDINNQITMATFSNGKIGIFDERVTKDSPISVIDGHTDSAITVSINRINDNIFATTGNENTVKIWDFRNFETTEKFVSLLTYKEHEAAIRGLAWSPKEADIIVTGGGIADRKVKKWNTTSGETIKTVNIGSQICNVFWNKEYQEILITCGPSANDISIWNDSTLKKIGDINDHHDRILYASMSPNNDKLVTVTPKDPIRIWNVFQQKINKPNLR